MYGSIRRELLTSSQTRNKFIRENNEDGKKESMIRFDEKKEKRKTLKEEEEIRQQQDDPNNLFAWINTTTLRGADSESRKIHSHREMPKSFQSSF